MRADIKGVNTFSKDKHDIISDLTPGGYINVKKNSVYYFSILKSLLF